MKHYLGQLEITKEALLQIFTIKKNDHTLENCEFRIRIKGKGCDGFTYDMGFSPVQHDDLYLSFKTKAGPIHIVFDPFTAHYVQEAKLDYSLSTDKKEAGFVLINHNEAQHEGKFFEDPSKLPKI